MKSEPSVKAETEDFGLHDFANDDFGPDSEEYPELNTDPITEFLEYCSLCSNQKELEEAEGGVSCKFEEYDAHYIQYFVYNRKSLLLPCTLLKVR